jgi:hypothetical protein
MPRRMIPPIFAMLQIVPVRAERNAATMQRGARRSALIGGLA